MAQMKAPKIKTTSDPESESWNKLPWRKLEQHVYRIQKRIFKAESRGNTRAVHKLQKLLMKSRAARLLAVRRVTQDNQGKRTAGIDGVKLVKPAQRFTLTEQIHPKQWPQYKPRPVRRIYIPKPGKDEKRPLGIPVMRDRSHQCLIKLALEPQWEAKFEPNSYGFRPGRSCHDAIEAIHTNICTQAKYVLDADIKGAFDHIDHQALLAKLDTYPAIRWLIKAWLKAGIIDNGVFDETRKGTPQGGVISPLLMNIALHGMETDLIVAYRWKEGRPKFVRYADDLVVFHPKLEGVEKARGILSEWLQRIGLELKPSKTRITHTLTEYQEKTGFDFLGFTIRQYPMGKTHTGRRSNGKPLGFKTLIRPSKEAIAHHVKETHRLVAEHRSMKQEKLIKELNPVIYGWANYYRSVCARRAFKHCDMVLFRQLERWANRRHPNKSRHWIMRKYWKVDEGKGWIFRTPDLKLRNHQQTYIRRHVKVKGTASPYDGDLLYWSQRLKKHPLLNGVKAKLLQKQEGKCRWCGLHFKDEDLIEIDHITPKSQGGGEELSNKFALHRHCHDERHSKRANGTYDKGRVTEEPCDGKPSSTVLKTSRSGDTHA